MKVDKVSCAKALSASVQLQTTLPDGPLVAKASYLVAFLSAALRKLPGREPPVDSNGQPVPRKPRGRRGKRNPTDQG